MGESCRFVHFFCVETEHRFVNVPFKVCLADEVICAEDDTLERFVNLYWNRRLTFDDPDTVDAIY